MTSRKEVPLLGSLCAVKPFSQYVSKSEIGLVSTLQVSHSTIRLDLQTSWLELSASLCFSFVRISHVMQPNCTNIMSSLDSFKSKDEVDEET